jgi:two-component SAPR family response regulator
LVDSTHAKPPCILVVEDEYLIAMDVMDMLEENAFAVIGPVGTVAAALELIRTRSDIGGAVLDVSISGDMVFPVAEALLQKGVPFFFSTGYDAKIFPAHLSAIPRVTKPMQHSVFAQTARSVFHR